VKKPQFNLPQLRVLERSAKTQMQASMVVFTAAQLPEINEATRQRSLAGLGFS
jgi:hypothetical protein